MTRPGKSGRANGFHPSPGIAAKSSSGSSRQNRGANRSVVTRNKALRTTSRRSRSESASRRGPVIKTAKGIGGRVRGAAQWAPASQRAGERGREGRPEASRVAGEQAGLQGGRADRNRHPDRDERGLVETLSCAGNISAHDQQAEQPDAPTRSG